MTDDVTWSLLWILASGTSEVSFLDLRQDVRGAYAAVAVLEVDGARRLSTVDKVGSLAICLALDWSVPAPSCCRFVSPDRGHIARTLPEPIVLMQWSWMR